MRGGLVGVGLLLALVGIIWVLQGTNILPGSFMSGQLFWAFVGLICLVLGALALVRGVRGTTRR